MNSPSNAPEEDFSIPEQWQCIKMRVPATISELVYLETLINMSLTLVDENPIKVEVFSGDGGFNELVITGGIHSQTDKIVNNVVLSFIKKMEKGEFPCAEISILDDENNEIATAVSTN